jgi:hypothetical protein
MPFIIGRLNLYIWGTDSKLVRIEYVQKFSFFMRHGTGYVHDYSQSNFSVAYVEVLGISREVMFHLKLQKK